MLFYPDPEVILLGVKERLTFPGELDPELARENFLEMPPFALAACFARMQAEIEYTLIMPKLHKRPQMQLTVNVAAQRGGFHQTNP